VPSISRQLLSISSFRQKKVECESDEGIVFTFTNGKCWDEYAEVSCMVLLRAFGFIGVILDNIYM
jgi:hypothetical protein